MISLIRTLVRTALIGLALSAWICWALIATALIATALVVLPGLAALRLWLVVRLVVAVVIALAWLRLVLRRLICAVCWRSGGLAIAGSVFVALIIAVVTLAGDRLTLTRWLAVGLAEAIAITATTTATATATATAARLAGLAKLTVARGRLKPGDRRGVKHFGFAGGVCGVGGRRLRQTRNIGKDDLFGFARGGHREFELSGCRG